MNAPHTVTPAEASAGHNKPAILTADMMARDFAYLDDALYEIETKVNDCPPVVEDDADLEIIREAVKRCAGAFKRLETLRVESKEPYLAATRIVDGHFGKLKDIVSGWQSTIEARAHRYLKKKEAAEKARREEEARKAAEAARVASERQRQAEEERRQAEQQRIAAEQATRQISVEHHQREENARREEARLREESAQAQAAALRTQKEAEAKPADLARTRSSDGLSTLQEFWTFEVLDPHAIDLQDPVLRSFIPWPDIEKAINRYVATHKDARPLAGVRIYPDTEVRMS
jgi:hypothetical protein